MSRSTAAAEVLLPGEAPQSDVLEDAEHWAAVYEELAGFLRTTGSAMPESMGRFQSRLEYWRHRRDELSR